MNNGWSPYVYYRYRSLFFGTMYVMFDHNTQINKCSTPHCWHMKLRNTVLNLHNISRFSRHACSMIANVQCRQ